MPNKLFPSQRPNEKILLVVREHWFRLFLKLFVIVLLAALPFLVRYLLSVSSTMLAYIQNPGLAIMTLIFQLYYMALLVALFVVWALYYLNLHIVSEERIVDIDQVGLLNHVVSELNVETIEDVSSQTTGLFGNILDYGTVFIQTAGATERFQFENVPHPSQIASIILEVYEKDQDRERPKP
jgi:hypothetical protein